MSDIGLFGPGFNTFASALAIIALGALLAVAALLTATARSRRRQAPFARDPAISLAVGGLVGVVLALGLAIVADGVGHEVGAILDSWLAAVVTGIALLSAVVGWGHRRALRS